MILGGQFLLPHFLVVVLFDIIFGCAGSLLMCGFFSSRSEQELLFAAMHRLLVAVASPVVYATGAVELEL